MAVLEASSTLESLVIDGGLLPGFPEKVAVLLLTCHAHVQEPLPCTKPGMRLTDTSTGIWCLKTTPKWIWKDSNPGMEHDNLAPWTGWLALAAPRLRMRSRAYDGYDNLIDPGKNVCCWSPDGLAIATVGEDSMCVSIRDMSSGMVLQRLAAPGFVCQKVCCITWSPNAKLIAAVTSNTAACVWDMGSEAQVLHVPEIAEDPLFFGAGNACWSRDSSIFAVEQADAVHMYDTHTWQLIARNAAYTSYTSAWPTVACSPDSALVADQEQSRCSQSTIMDQFSTAQPRLSLCTLWDVGNYECWSPDGSMLAGGGEHGVVVWDVEGQKLWDLCCSYTRQIRATSPMRDLSLESSTWGMEAPSKSGDVRVYRKMREGYTPRKSGLEQWSAEAPNKPKSSRKGLGDPLSRSYGSPGVSSLSWSPDSSKLAAGRGRYIVVWCMASGEVLLQLKCVVRVHSVAWHPSRQDTIAVGTSDGAVAVWQLCKV